MNRCCLDFFRGIPTQFTYDLVPLLIHPYVTSFYIPIILIPSPFPLRTSFSHPSPLVHVSYLLSPFVISYDIFT